MILRVYAAYDSKVEAFLQPFFMQTKGAAIRAFSESVNDPKTQFNRFPGDFALFELGQYDDQKGLLIPRDVPLSLGLAQEFINEKA